MDLAELLLHDIEIIQQPLRGRRDGLLFSDGACDRAIIIEKQPAVFGDAFD